MKVARKLWTWALALVATFALVLGLSTVASAAVGSVPPHTKNITDNQDGTYTISLDIVGESEKKPNNVNVIVIFDTSGSMNTTRMNAAKNAVNSLANSLYAYNTTENPNTVEMALVQFATSSTIAQNPTTSQTTFTGAVNGLGNAQGAGSGGTNWESALQTALNVDFGDEDQTFVVFVSDGNPTFRTTQNGWNDWSQWYQQWGTGEETTQNIQRCYTTAVDDAQALATKVTPANFFTIGAFGNVDRMEQLTDDAGSDSSTNYYSAQNTAALNQAIADILAKIEMAGFADAEIDDGTTNQVTTTSGDIAELLELVPNFQYYRSGGSYGFMQPWTDAPAAKVVNGKVEWDLSSVGVLENGVRYTVTFDCYPSQLTYDTIAQLKNGDIQYSQLDSEIQKYIVDNGNGSYSLRTNTNAGIAWDDTRDDAGRQTSAYKNPDPVKTESSTLTATKEWEGGEPDVDSLEITVLMDDKPFHSAKISKDNGWSTSSFISPGIIKNNQVLPGAEGHDFKFAELGSEQYHWELESPVVHPMLIDGELTMLIMVDKAHEAPAGAQTYTINGSTYYVDSSAAGLTAVNHRRSNLNLTKVVTGEDAPKDATFPFTLTVNNSKAANGSADDTDSDYYVWFSIYDTKAGAPVMDATVTGATGPNADGFYYAPSGSAITVQMKDSWNLRFTNLPSGTTYTFAEGALPEGFAFNKAELTQGEDSTFSGGQTSAGTIENTKTSYTVTYTNDYQLTDLEITKVWSDANNQDGIRLTADELAAKLTLSPAVEGKTPTVVENEDGTYTITYTGLPRFNNGEEVTYTVTESAIDGYTTTGSPAEDHGTITNTHEPEVIDIPVEKIWKGPEGDAVTVTLYADDAATTNTVTLNANNNWKGTFEDLPKKAAGKDIKYTVVEAGVSGVDASKYTTTITGDAENGFVITNTNTETVDIEVTKAWADASNQDGIRPENLTLTLDGAPEGTTVPDPAITKSGDNWTYKWTGLPKYTEDGTEIQYTVSEDEVPSGYTKSPTDPVSTGGTITNTHTPEVTEATVKKVWDDAENQDGKRPTELKVTLSNGAEVTLTAANQWTQTVSNLPKYADGVEIVYTWTEGTLPDGYTLTNTSKEGTVTTLTNSYTPEETSATVKKVWDDANDQDRKRPAELKVTLSNGTEVTLTADNNWTQTVSGLPKFADGVEIEYTWTEGTLPEGYTLSKTEKDGTVTTLTNSYTPEETSATVKKVWDDAENQDGKRPETLTVNLSDGEHSVTLSEENGWTATVTGLPKYSAGDEIVYTWTEGTMPEGYTLSKTEKDGTVTTLTNSYTPEETSATVKKVWDDADNQDGIRPASLEVTLSDGQKVTLSETNSWTATITGLPKFADGVEIEYTWTEGTLPEGYTLTNTSKEGTVTTLTNSHTPAETEATVKKVWDDAEDQDGFRPETLTVTLSDGQTVTLSEDNGWTATITGLPKYADGVEIEYSWTEADIAEYTLTGAAKEGTVTTLTNRHVPEQIEIDVEKVWVDENNQDGKRPESVSVNLLSNGTIVDTVELNEQNEWKYTWTKLDKYAGGEEIEYTVEEVKTDVITGQDGPGTYEDEVTGDIAEGYIVTNTHTPETVDVSVEKVWDDDNNRDGKQPESLTVTLSNGDTVTLGASNNWKATIAGLPKYSAGVEIEYTWTEADIDGYELTGTAAEGYVTKLTNSHTPERTTVTVTKVWDDADDKDGIRPDEITVTLLADGVEAGTAVLSEGNEWTYTWTDLYKYAEGKEIAYTVSEEQVKGYDEPEITGTAAEGFTIKNHHIAKPDAVMSDPLVQKVVQGNPPTPATFTFQMKAVTEGAPMPDGSADGIMTVQITGTGSEKFGEMWFEEAGEWVYEITELNGGVEGYTYDTSTKYTLTITVEEVPDGSQVKLVKTETVTGGNGSGTAVFTNVYKPPVPKTGDATPQVGMLALAGALVAGISAFGARRRED